MKRRYVTADVFTTEALKGNPVAVVLDAEGLSTAQMQAIAAEFVYSETTFVLPPQDPANTAHIRIFTPSREIPFAGHPNIGTAYVLATGDLAAAGDQPEPFIFEELAGLVPVRQLMNGSTVVGAELITPEPLSEASELSAAQVAECLSLTEDDILVTAHRPKVVSVGLPFLVAELASRSALTQCVPNLNAYKRFLPLDGATSIYVYTRDVSANTAAEAHTDIQARMFTARMTEDPATGSATAAMSAFFARVHARPTLSLTVGQGFDMGRPSTLYVNIDTHGTLTQVRVGGNCVRMMEGTFELAGDA